MLASSEACANQAFRARGNVYGLQFHLEVTPEMIADWTVQDENCGDICELSDTFDPNCNSKRLKHLSALVFGGWAGLL